MRTRAARGFIAVALFVAASYGAGVAAAASPKRTSSKARRPPLDLVWHVETMDGKVLDSKSSDAAINPASIVKVATSWWAMERLGPDYRFGTRVLARGRVDRTNETLIGDLVFEGAGDPDFHAENVFLVAAGLNDLGVKQVTGSLVVDRKFWIGWEGGSAGTNKDPHARGLLMAGRLRRALDPKRWDRVTATAWRTFAARRGLDPVRPPRVTIRGSLVVEAAASGNGLLLVHRSNPLETTLRRFNCFSNNDIERIGEVLGPASELAWTLATRWAVDMGRDQIHLATTSGLGENRLTPRLVVRLLRDLRTSAETRGKRIEDLLPVAGCDPGTVAHFFPKLNDPKVATALVGKTGTLTSTDGGVSVLAGYLNTTRGELVFCVAAPKALGRIRTARRAEETWILELLGRQGGAQPRSCAPALATADADATVTFASEDVTAGGALSVR
jgi:D-alanyl-D-alanine carboxypeptidase/D-alanyl-D-alanine-endopeptidase (penicillin-binding protein 4)